MFSHNETKADYFFSELEISVIFRLRVCLSKLEAPQTIFIVIFELSGVKNPYKQQISIKLAIFENLKKNTTVIYRNKTLSQLPILSSGEKIDFVWL